MEQKKNEDTSLILSKYCILMTQLENLFRSHDYSQLEKEKIKNEKYGYEIPKVINGYSRSFFENFLNDLTEHEKFHDDVWEFLQY